MADFAESSEPLTKLPFAPVTKTHILNCSFHSWHSRYRSFTPKARVIPLSQPFVDYLKADGIYLPPEESERRQGNAWSDTDSGIFSSAENEDAANAASDDDDEDPSAQWPEIHEAIRATIQELGGRVVPKLNWSAPKDATWIATGNSMDCRTPNEVYLLLKSSDFVTHDLENVFDDTVDEDEQVADKETTGSTGAVPEGTVATPDGSSATPSTKKLTLSDIPYHLVLRKYVQLNPSLEFRCFVRARTLLCMCQRDLNHYDFLFGLAPQLRSKIVDFFEEKLKNTFPDDSFVFDVYIPPPHKKVWLVDINPWASRTDPLLFSWLEILTMPQPSEPKPAPVVTLKISNIPDTDLQSDSKAAEEKNKANRDFESETDSELDDDDEEDIFSPEVRLVKKDDPEAYAFTSPQYSAHKLPRDVVDAAASAQSDGAGLREFATQWKEALERRQREEQEAYSSADET